MSKNKSSLASKIYRRTRLFIFKDLGLEPKFLRFYETYRQGKKYKNSLTKGGTLSSDNIDKEEPIYYPDYTVTDTNVYIAQIPNQGAGIGHQMANYNCGLHLALKYGIGHAYVPFVDKDWDRFLGFGQNEPTIEDLKCQGYKVKKLPSISIMGHDMLDAIVAYYKQSGQKVILLTQIDEFYAKQYGVIPYIKRKFEEANARKDDDKLLGDHAEVLLHKNSSKGVDSVSEQANDNNHKLEGVDFINIAVHIRRGDINSGQVTGDKQLTMRWLSNEYYEKVLDQVVSKLEDKKINLFIFSQGDKKDYESYEKYGQVYYCLDMSPMESFIRMVRADILITSKSSFSYKPALLSDGIRICPKGFWHGYPDDEKWIVAEEDGEIKHLYNI